MRISSKQYAQALIEAVSDKKGKAADEAFDNFVKLLAQNNDLKLADEICRQVENIYNEQNGILEAEVISAEKLAKKEEEIKNQIKSDTGAQDIILKNIIDKDILGGMIIKYGDKVVDTSLRTRLVDMRKHLAK